MPISISNTTLTFNNGTTMTTAATGTVSSVATGNGLSGGTITTSGTLVIACPNYNSVGSYVQCQRSLNTGTLNINGGTNYAAGSGNNQIVSVGMNDSGSAALKRNDLSGTWKWMSGSPGDGGTVDYNVVGIACRVS